MQRNQERALSQDEVFDILSNGRRRYVLYYLQEADGPVNLDELARELAAWENETTVEELTKQQRKRVYVSLYQTHIQKLADAGVVEYDRESGMLTLAKGANQIDAYIADDRDRVTREKRWQIAYVALSAVSAVFYALVAFDVSVFGLMTQLQAGSLIVISFAVLASVHYLYTRQQEPDLPTAALIQNR